MTSYLRLRSSRSFWGSRPPAGGKPRPSARVILGRTHHVQRRKLRQRTESSQPCKVTALPEVIQAHSQLVARIFHAPAAVYIPGGASPRWLCRPPGFDGGIRPHTWEKHNSSSWEYISTETLPKQLVMTPSSCWCVSACSASPAMGDG